jgi:hypothetical protein
MIDCTKCKRKGVRRDGEICNLSYCTYPKCLQDDYCPKCHKTKGVHKLSCSIMKIIIIDNETLQNNT